MVKSILVVVLFGLVAVGYVSAANKCYICSECETATGEANCSKDELPVKDDNTAEEDKFRTDTPTDSSTTEPPVPYNCFTVSTKTGDNTKVQRGCTKETSCEKVNFGQTAEGSCMICKEDSCNSASNIQRFALGIVAFIAVFMMFL